jgi:hypothetical protein
VQGTINPATVPTYGHVQEFPDFQNPNNSALATGASAGLGGYTPSTMGEAPAPTAGDFAFGPRSQPNATGVSAPGTTAEPNTTVISQNQPPGAFTGFGAQTPTPASNTTVISQNQPPSYPGAITPPTKTPAQPQPSVNLPDIPGLPAGKGWSSVPEIGVPSISMPNLRGYGTTSGYAGVGQGFTDVGLDPTHEKTLDGNDDKDVGGQSTLTGLQQPPRGYIPKGLPPVPSYLMAFLQGVSR